MTVTIHIAYDRVSRLCFKVTSNKIGMCRGKDKVFVKHTLIVFFKKNIMKRVSYLFIYSILRIHINVE